MIDIMGLVSPTIWLIVFALWCGFVWRLRGGALATLLRIHVGTDGTRMICSMLIGLPLLAVHFDSVAPGLIVIAIFGGLKLTGWGPFQGEGLENKPGYVPQKSWMRALPDALGLKVGTFWHDFVGMTVAGIVCMAPPALVCGWVGAWTLPSVLEPLLAGALFSVAYAIARLGFPTIPNFAKGQSWGEVGAGMLVGTALGFRFIL